MTKCSTKRYIRNIEERTGLKLEALPKNADYEIGKIYYSGYWSQWFIVLEYKKLSDSYMKSEVKCIWQDGSITHHCTPLNLSLDDYLVM